MSNPKTYERVTDDELAEAERLGESTVAANEWYSEHGPRLAAEVRDLRGELKTEYDARGDDIRRLNAEIADLRAKLGAETARANLTALTTEQAERWSCWLGVDTGYGANTWLRDALMSASRGETGPA